VVDCRAAIVRLVGFAERLKSPTVGACTTSVTVVLCVGTPLPVPVIVSV